MVIGNLFRPKRQAPKNAPVLTTYESKEVDVPAKYLRYQPDDAQPITYKKIDFNETVLPEYRKYYAVVLDNVLSPSECAELIKLAESSVLEKDIQDGSPWRPAMVNVGQGFELLQADYRNSDRIIWDNQDIVDRVWARLETVPEVLDKLSRINEDDLVGGNSKGWPSSVWKFHKVNKRLRFLKYGSGQFFRPHCDGAYGETTPDGKILRTHFTVHLYLNDSKQEVPEAELVGGATSFLSTNETRKLDVDPKAGRVLIFQHKRLYHSGDDVKAGTKYTVRTDIMYELEKDIKDGGSDK